MSIPFGTSLLSAAANGLVGPVLVRQRSIGGFVADVTLSEEHEDELVVTENPVEQGADVTDHSFKKPARLTVRCGFSNSDPQAGGDTGYVDDVYAGFLALQAGRGAFDVITGKRAYQNMLITLLRTTTDLDTENSLVLVVSMREVILVSTQVVSVPSSSVMSAPQSNGATQNLGAQSLATGSSFNSSAAPSSASFESGG